MTDDKHCTLNLEESTDAALAIRSSINEAHGYSHAKRLIAIAEKLERGNE